MNEYLGITCRYIHTCNNAADLIILYGCWDQHLSELAVCIKCYRKWQQTYRDTGIYCRCAIRIGDYNLINLENTTAQYRNEYVFGTQHPNTREPYATPMPRH